MAYIPSHQDLGDHPKLLKLALELKIIEAQAVGHLQYLWWWALDYAQKGDISKFSAVEISKAARWHGSPVFFMAKLQKCGWVVTKGPKKWLHAWKKHAYLVILAREKNRERQERFRNSTTVNRNRDITVMSPLHNALKESKEKESISKGEERNGRGLHPLESLPHLATPPGSKNSLEAIRIFQSHVLKTYQDHFKSPYHWSPGNQKRGTQSDHDILTDLTVTQGAARAMAMWDVFLKKDWDWRNKQGEAVKVPHTLREFYRKLPELLERRDWQKKAEEYEAGMAPAEPGGTPDQVGKLVTGLLKPVAEKSAEARP